MSESIFQRKSTSRSVWSIMKAISLLWKKISMFDSIYTTTDQYLSSININYYQAFSFAFRLRFSDPAFSESTSFAQSNLSFVPIWANF